MRRALLLILVCLAGCKAFPNLDGRDERAAQRAPWPKLVALDPILAQAATVTIRPESIADLPGRSAALRRRGLAPPQLDADLASRGAALRARAAALRKMTVGG